MTRPINRYDIAEVKRELASREEFFGVSANLLDNAETLVELESWSMRENMLAEANSQARLSKSLTHRKTVPALLVRDRNKVISKLRLVPYKPESM